MKYITILFIFLPLLLSAQSGGEEAQPPPAVLQGTTILPNTVNQRHAKAYGLSLVGVDVKPCDTPEDPSERRLNQVVAITETGGRLEIALSIRANCCHDFLCDIDVVEDSILNLIFYGYGSMYCECTCCFGLGYHLERMPFGEYQQLKQIMINGDRRTLRKW